MFIETTDNELIPVSNISRIGEPRAHPKGHAAIHTVNLTNGPSITVFTTEVTRLMNTPSTLIPAQEGTHVVMLSYHEVAAGKLPNHFLTPVIAWGVAPKGYAVPVTINGANNGDDDNVPVLMPSGKVLVGDDATYENLGEFLQERVK